MSLEPESLRETVGEYYVMSSVGYSFDELEQKNPEELLEGSLERYAEVIDTVESSEGADSFSVPELLDGINDLESGDTGSFYQDLTIMELKGLIEPVEEFDYGSNPHLYRSTEEMDNYF